MAYLFAVFLGCNCITSKPNNYIMHLYLHRFFNSVDIPYFPKVLEVHIKTAPFSLWLFFLQLTGALGGELTCSILFKKYLAA